MVSGVCFYDLRLHCSQMVETRSTKISIGHIYITSHALISYLTYLLMFCFVVVHLYVQPKSLLLAIELRNFVKLTLRLLLVQLILSLHI